MRQQEANQFDKGLNLDTNPIAMNNHQLSGALNATMITMNGNELVLLNDMGNGRVDQALLPEGYVPVGMKEYGGIVYVASYNPLNGESLVGCFPSPQRNLASEDIGAPHATLNEFLPDFDRFPNAVRDFLQLGFDTAFNRYAITTTSSQCTLIDEPLRAGDKFIIVSNNFDNIDESIERNFAEVKITVVDDEGNSVDITDDLREYEGPDYNPNNTYPHFKKIIKDGDSLDYNDYYNIYKNKISGRLTIQKELILPSYIDVSVSAESISNDKVRISFYTQAYNLNGGLWIDNIIEDYLIKIKCNNTVSFFFNHDNHNFIEVDKNTILSYEVYPVYSYGIVTKLKRTGSIDVSLIGTGEVRFDVFRYYNDIAKNQILVEYSLQAYIENSAYSLTKLYIEAYDIEDLFDDDGSWKYALPGEPHYDSHMNNVIKVPLNVDEYFGTYTAASIYKANASHFNINKYYIGRICAVVTKGNNDISTYSDWYAIITTNITNQDYLNSNHNMYPISSSDELKIFELNWNANISRELVETNTPLNIVETTPEGLTNNVITDLPSNVDNNNISNFLAKYLTTKVGQLEYNFSADAEVTSSIPFNSTLSVTPIISTPTYTKTITYDGNTSLVLNGELVTSVENETDLSTEDTEDFYYSNEGSLIINYRIKSLLFAKLKHNPNFPENSIDGYKWLTTCNNCIVPSIPNYCYNSSEDINVLTNIFGNNINITTKVNQSSVTADTELTQSHIYDIENQKSFKYNITESDYSGCLGSGLTKILHWMEKGKYSVLYGNDTLLPETEFNTTYSHTENNGHTTITQYSLGNPNNPENYATNIKQKEGNKLPLFIVWNGGSSLKNISNNWRGKENHNNDDGIYGNGTSNYAILLMLSSNNKYYALNLFIYGTNNKHFLSKVVNAFGHIYILQPNVTLDVEYFTLSDIQNDYLCTNNYSVNFKTTISTDNNSARLSLNSHFNKYNLGEVEELDYNFPIFTIKQQSKSAEYSDSVSAPDLSFINIELLDGSIPSEVPACAIIKDSYGKTVLTSAYKYVNQTRIPVSLNTSHRYLYCGRDLNLDIRDPGELSGNPQIIVGDPEPPLPILIDIDETDLENTNYVTGLTGLNVAKAIKGGLVILSDSLIENWNVFVLNDNVKNNLRISDADNKYYYGLCRRTIHKFRVNGDNEKWAVTWRQKLSHFATLINIKLLLGTYDDFTETKETVYDQGWHWNR